MSSRIFHLSWFTLDWYKYLFKGLINQTLWTGLPIWKIFWCRVQGHQHGVIWYNPGGSEPDMRCSNCLEDQG